MKFICPWCGYENSKLHKTWSVGRHTRKCENCDNVSIKKPNWVFFVLFIPIIFFFAYAKTNLICAIGGGITVIALLVVAFTFPYIRYLKNSAEEYLLKREKISIEWCGSNRISIFFHKITLTNGHCLNILIDGHFFSFLVIEKYLKWDKSIVLIKTPENITIPEKEFTLTQNGKTIGIGRVLRASPF